MTRRSDAQTAQGRRLFYWIPPSRTGAPEEVTHRLWGSLRPLAHELDLELHSFTTAGDLARLLAQVGRADLVHFGKTPVASVSLRSRALALALSRRLPLSTHVHGDIRAEFRLLWKHSPIRAFALLPSWYLTPALLRLHKLVVANSRAMAKTLESQGVDARRIAVIPNPVDVLFWTTRPNEAAPVGGEYVFAHGRLSSEKGFDILIRAVAHARLRTRVLLAGAGPERSALQRLASNLGVSVEFLGWQSPDQLRTLLRGASVAVYPSRHEPFSLAALEALLSAPRVLVSNRAGIVEFLPSELARQVAIDPSVGPLARGLMSPPSIGPGAARLSEMFAPDRTARAFANRVLIAMGA